MLFRQMLTHRRLDRGNESEIVMSIEVPTFISQRMLLLEAWFVVTVDHGFSMGA